MKRIIASFLLFIAFFGGYLSANDFEQLQQYLDSGGLRIEAYYMPFSVLTPIPITEELLKKQYYEYYTEIRPEGIGPFTSTLLTEIFNATTEVTEILEHTGLRLLVEFYKDEERVMSYYIFYDDDGSWTSVIDDTLVSNDIAFKNLAERLFSYADFSPWLSQLK